MSLSRYTLLPLALLLIQPVVADEIRMAFGEKLPPYILPETQSGIEIDIVKEALALKGHKLIPEFLPMARLTIAYKNKNVDALMMDVGEPFTEKDGHYAEVPVVYQNVFITLKKRKIIINKPSDLKGFLINGFVGAEKRFPDWLSNPSKTNNYFEKSDQSLQVQQLLLGRIDIALSEPNIFKYYYLQTKTNKDFFAEIEIHQVIKENPLNYRPVFRSKKIRDDFNYGLSVLKKNGRIQEIYSHYLSDKK